MATDTPKGGLEDVVATSSAICYLDGERGVLVYCGYDIHDLAQSATFLAEQIETLVGEDDAYEQAQRRARALLDQGFHLGGRIESTRDEWHER